MGYMDNEYIPRLLAVKKIGNRLYTEDVPQRDTVLSADDILNLQITLETTKDVNEFLERI